MQRGVIAVGYCEKFDYLKNTKYYCNYLAYASGGPVGG